jgi:catecholate siderophore receptor
LKKTLPTSQTLGLGAKTVLAALACSGLNAQANDTPTACADTDSENCQNQADYHDLIEEVRVHGVKHSVYLQEKSGDIRRMADLSETPQVINVLTQDQIQESGRTDLREILSAQAGVTLGTGENGNAFGDRYIIRGHEARSDVFVDGLRDPGMTTRESFATERVEIAKGPSATFAGRGTSGGAVNSITKKASTAYSFGRADLGLGTDDYHRLTFDYNIALSDNAALRLNALDAEETKPGREGIERSREGAQLSGALEATSKLFFTADAYYLSAEDVPDLGSYFDRTEREPIENIPVYAQDSDFLNSEVSTFTLRTEYHFSDNVHFHNSTRIGQTENEYITTGIRGSTRDASDPDAPGEATLSLSTHQGWQEVDYKASQFNLLWANALFGIEQQWVFGLEYSDERVDNGVFSVSNNGDTNCVVGGRRGASPSYCILDASGNPLSHINLLMSRSYSRGDADALFNIETVSAYIMDTLQITDHSKLFFGLRQDKFDYRNDVSQRGADGLLAFEISDSNFNGHIGFVQDVTDQGNIYLSYATATNINGGESDLGANCGYGGLCGTPEQATAASPETVVNLELGTKWMLFDDELMLSASAFQMTKSDVMESVGNDYSTLGTLNTGENRVKGIEFGALGEITEQLSVQFSVAIMDSEVTESHDADNVGLALSNFAEKSAYLQLRYQPTERFVFGGSYAYQSEMYGGQPDTAAGYDADNSQYSIVVPSYSVVNLFAQYTINDSFTVRTNIGNVFDKEYWTAAYRSGSFMYLGDGRSTRISLTYEF